MVVRRVDRHLVVGLLLRQDVEGRDTPRVPLGGGRIWSNPLMRFPSRPRARLWWARATWVIPVLGVFAGVLLFLAVTFYDDVVFLVQGGDKSLSAGAATTILAAIGGGMVTFTGFVFSFVLLIVQFGSTAYSPRTVTHFLRGRAVQWILALFLATITFSFLSVLDVGSLGREDFVPTTAVSLSVGLLVASLLGFIALLHSIGSRIRVDAVLTDIGRGARNQLVRRVAAAPRGGQVAPEPSSADGPEEQAGPSVVADYHGRSGQVVAIDATRLARLARRHACGIQVIPRVGDAITTGTPAARVVGAERALDREISGAFVVDVERSLWHDPLYALRLLVDVAIRALSPAVNDPTTAVRALDEIEGVLRAAGSRQLGSTRIEVPPGSLVLAGPSWDDLVDLALLEIFESGRGQVQISRRLTALLDDLIPDVDQSRGRILAEYRLQLDAEVTGMTGRARSIALQGDRQGLGGSG